MNFIFYCEQLHNSIQWLNIGSNVAFFIAAGCALWWLQKHHKKLTKQDIALVTLLALIGGASFLWHTFPSEWTRYIDILFIGFFGVGVFSVLVQDVFQNTTTKNIITVIALLIGLSLKEFNGGFYLLPYLFLIFIMGIVTMHLFKKQHNAYVLVRNALFIFLVSIVIKNLDLIWCDLLPMGTHFIWHILTAIVGYYLVVAAGMLRERS